MMDDACIILGTKGWSLAKFPSCAFLRTCSSTQRVPTPSWYIRGSSVGGPTVMNNGTREEFTLRILPPSKSGSDTLFNSQSSSSLLLQMGQRTGPAIKQRTAG